jgi:putative ABC transport system substrate-binding protein
MSFGRLGHVEGQNLTVDRYGADQNISDVAKLAAEVIRSGPDVIYVAGPGAIFFKSPITTIPVVTVTGNPVVRLAKVWPLVSLTPAAI